MLMLLMLLVQSAAADAAVCCDVCRAPPTCWVGGAEEQLLGERDARSALQCRGVVGLRC